MRKRIASLLVGGILVAGSAMGFTACKSKDSSNKLILWGPNEQQESLKQMVELFLEQNPDFSLDIEVQVASEGEAYAQMSKDPEAGADVYAFANDQIVNLYSIGALAPLGDAKVAEIKANNSASSVEACRIGEDYYGYPYAADNGFFLYYDSNVISAEEAKSLDKILAACDKNDKFFVYQLTTGWYAGSFIYGAGGEYTVTYEDAQVTDIKCNFDQKPEGSDYTYGELGGQALIDLRKNAMLKNGDDSVLKEYLNYKGKGNMVAACVTGTWNASFIADAFGDGYAATILPKWTSSLDGNTYDWKSFAGYKLYGVNSFSNHIDEAHELAAFLSSEAMQEKRFDDNEIGPSNTVVAAMDKVKANIAIGAISEQLKPENSVVQTAMPGSYWSEMESFATAMKDWDGKGDLLQRVKDLVTALKAH